MAKINFIAIPFISPMSVDIQEKMNCVKKKKFCFFIEGSRTIPYFIIQKFITDCQYPSTKDTLCL